MISVPVGVLITQWVMLFALSGLVIVMFRQLAHLLHLSGAAGDAGGLDVGASAPTFNYRRPGESTLRSFHPGAAPTMLLFTDPRCGACEAALGVVEKATEGSRSLSLRVLVVTDADDTALAANEGLGRTPLDIALVEHGVVTRDYRVTGTPLLMAVDPSGAVRAKLVAPDLSTTRRLIRSLHHRSDDSHHGEVGAVTTAQHQRRR